MNRCSKGMIAMAFLGFAAASMPVQAADETVCGTDRKIDIAEMSWPSAAALARIHAFIRENGYGCDVEVVSGDTVPTSSSMLARGTPAIAPELWTSSIEKQWNEAVDAGKVVKLSDAITDGTLEGWFIPRYVQEAHPELKSVEDVIAHPEWFPDPENPDKGRLYSCPPGWACELSTSALFEAYDMENKGWTLFSPGSGGALDASIARAFLRQEPILFYYWGPTSILGKFDAVPLDMGEVNEAVYACNTNTECDEPAGKTGYPSSPAIVGAASWVPEEAPVVAEYFSKVGLTNDEISALLVYGDENKADAVATAENFLRTQDDVWKAWVPADVASKVEASLG